MNSPRLSKLYDLYIGESFKSGCVYHFTRKEMELECSAMIERGRKRHTAFREEEMDARLMQRDKKRTKNKKT
jgi:hypothetical protein